MRQSPVRFDGSAATRSRLWTRRGVAAAAPRRRRRRRLRFASPLRAVARDGCGRDRRRCRDVGAARGWSSDGGSRRRRSRHRLAAAGSTVRFGRRRVSRRARRAGARATSRRQPTESASRQSRASRTSTSGFCASSARRTSASNGSRPTFTSGGVRNQYSTRGRTLPRRFVVGCDEIEILVAALVAREPEERQATSCFFFGAAFFAFAAGFGLAASALPLRRRLRGLRACGARLRRRGWSGAGFGAGSRGAASGARRRRFAAAMDEREPHLVADGVIAPDLGDVDLVVLAEPPRDVDHAGGTYRWNGRAKPGRSAPTAPALRGD